MVETNALTPWGIPCRSGTSSGFAARSRDRSTTIVCKRWLAVVASVRVAGAAETHRNVSSSVDAHADDGHLGEPDGADSEIPWFYARDELQSGPFPFSEIKRLAEQGALYPDDLVWCNGMPEWIEAASVPGLLATSSLRRRGQPWWIVSIVVAALLAGIAWLLRSFR